MKFPLIWDPESGVAPLSPDSRLAGVQPVRCLWSTGPWVNQAELIRQAGIDEPGGRDWLGALHDRFGESLPRRVLGALSWIVWDQTRRELTLVRDRLGLGGLYWRRRDRRFEVSAEVESLLPDRLDAGGVNLLSVASHLRGGAPLEGQTFHQDVHAVAPGQSVVLSAGGVRSFRYWTPAAAPGLKPEDECGLAARLWRLLVEVASDYAAPNAGIALSGGLDSTSLAAALRACGSAPALAAFTGTSPEAPEADESARAGAVCRHLGLDRTEIRADFESPLGEGLRTGRESPHYFYYTEWWDALLDRAETLGVQTLYSGGGGDHLFAGVSGYPDLLLTGRWRSLWKQLRRHAALSGSGGLPSLLRRRLAGPVLYAYLPWWRRRCLPAPTWLGVRLRGAYREAQGRIEAPMAALPGRIHRLRRIEVPRISQFCEHLNRRAEARGIRLIHPLLDHRLVDFAVGIRSWRVSGAGWDKVVLRRAVEGRLPPEVTSTREKVVPSPILRRALAKRRGDLVKDLLTSMRAAELGWVEPSNLARAVDLFLEGKSADSTFWFALTLEDWLRRHF